MHLPPKNGKVSYSNIRMEKIFAIAVLFNKVSRHFGTVLRLQNVIIQTKRNFIKTI